jgi:hypothetical protein
MKYAKWGSFEEFLLNWVKSGTKLILGGKKWNSLIAERRLHFIPFTME